MGVAGGIAPAFNNIVTDSVHIIHIVPRISLVPSMPSFAIGAKNVASAQYLHICIADGERNQAILKSSRSVMRTYCK